MSKREYNETAVAGWSHVLPFAAWILWMAVLEWVGGPAPWKYLVRTLFCAGAFLYLRPWRWYAPPVLRHVPAALGMGVLMWLAWILPELEWTGGCCPAAQEFYLKWAVFPLGRVPDVSGGFSYAAGPGWQALRLAGSALVIAPIEEFFWRGFLYRWFLRRNFLEVDPGAGVDWKVVLLLSLAFGLEHERWLAGALAGLAYLWLYLRTRDLWAAVIAHVLTNFLLGVTVLAAGAYRFW